MVLKRMRTRGADGEESSRRLRLEDGQRVEEVRDLLGGRPAVRRQRRPPRRTARRPTRASSPQDQAR